MSPNLMSIIFGAVMAMAVLVVVGASIAMVVAEIAVLIAVGGGVPATWKAWRALRVQTSPCSTSPADSTPAWPDEDMAFASLAEMARQRIPESRPTAPTAGIETRLSADELVLEMLHTLAADYQRTPRAQMSL
jgi:hypothetical protein